MANSLPTHLILVMVGKFLQLVLILGILIRCAPSFPGLNPAVFYLLGEDSGSGSGASGRPYFDGITTVEISGTAGLRLRWEAGLDDQTPRSELIYDIFQSQTAHSQNFSSPVASSAAGATSHTLTGLTVGQTYYFVVRARDSDNLRDTNTVERSGVPVDTVYLTGVQTNLSLASLAGWSVCHTSLYANASPLATIQADCSRTNLLLACRLVATPDNLIVAAHAPRTDVLTDVGTGTNSFHDANGSSWYFNATSSWGFFEPGDGVSRSSCDTMGGSFPERRLCWHTSNDVNGGYRCGSTASLNSSTDYERVILHAD